MAIISNLIARLTADTSAFERGAGRARKSLYGITTESARTQKALLGIARGTLGLVGLGAGIYGLRRVISSVTAAVIEQEKAELDLAAAIGETDNRHSQAVATLKAYAANLQRLTIYGDEEILSQMAYAANLGVTTDRLEEATKAAIGLAAKYRIDLRSAMMLVGRASQGQTQTLTRYGIILDQTLTDQEKFNRLLEIGAGAFGLATAQTKTAEGAMKQLTNIWGDFKEDIGPGVIDVLKGITKWVKQNEEGLSTLAELFKQVGDSVVEMGRLPETLDAISTALNKGTERRKYPTGIWGFTRQEMADLSRRAQQPNLPQATLEISPRGYQRLAEMRARRRLIDEGVFNFRGPLPGTEYQVEAVEQIKKQTNQTEILVTAMRREVELAKLSALERAKALAVDKYREAIQRDIESGLDRSVELTEAERKEVERLAAEQFQISENAKRATVDVTAAYVRMYDSIDSRTLASYEARRRLIDQEFDEYEKVLGQSIEIEQARQDALANLAIDRAKGAGSFTEGWAAGIERMKRDLPTVGQLGADLAVSFRDGVVRSLSDAVFEAENLGDALEDVARSMAKMAFEWGVQNAITGGLSALFPAKVAHGGGIFGKDSFPTRTVPAGLFAGVPRLHDGLRSNEFAAIVERGEEIHSKGQVAASRAGNGEMLGLLREIAGLLRIRQTVNVNAAIVDNRDVVTRQQMESREGEKLVMHHVGRNR